MMSRILYWIRQVWTAPILCSDPTCDHCRPIREQGHGR